MKEGRDLVKEAVKDAQSLKDAAVQAAKNQIIESLAPGVRALVEKNLKGAFGAKNEDSDRLRRGIEDNWPGESHTGFEEAKENKGEDPKMDADTKNPQELDMESLASFFPQLAEADPAAEDGLDLEAAVGVPGIPTLGEEDEVPAAPEAKPEDEVEMKKEAKKADKEEEKMDEEIEISEAELRKVYEAALQTEVQVKKGFGDMTKSGELDEVDPAAGIADVKKGEGQWAEAEVPAKQDFTVKEAKALIARGLAENKALKAKLAEAVKMIQALSGRLSETNLFNAKVLHVNRMLNSARLTNEQKKVVMESIDKAKTLDEVKMVYETLTNSFKAAKSLTESTTRKPAANVQRARTSGSPNQKVLSESVDQTNNGGFDRLKKLAGIVK